MSFPSTIWSAFRWPNQGSLSAVSIVVLLMFSACSSLPQVDVRTVPVEVPRPEARPRVPNPQPVETAPIEWMVITKDRLPDGEFVLYGLTPKQYETLARNMADILRWVKEAEWRLNYYRGEGGVDGVPVGKP